MLFFIVLALLIFNRYVRITVTFKKQKAKQRILDASCAVDVTESQRILNSSLVYFGIENKTQINEFLCKLYDVYSGIVMHGFTV